MFTGIVEELGEVVALTNDNLVNVLFVRAKGISLDVKKGDSVSVNGVCLTVVDNSLEVLKFDVLNETFKKTNIRKLALKDKVNLERALKSDSRLGGHFVTGHIDYIAKIKKKENQAQAIRIEFVIPPEFMRYVVEKGSIAIDGISLTIGEVGDDYFSSYIIPHTISNTTLGFKKQADTVNVEADILAKYIQKPHQDSKKSNLTIEFLSKNGFM